MRVTLSSAALILLLSSSGCQWIGDTADSIGRHMPVMGERCENWQCFTQSGRQASQQSKIKPSGPSMHQPINQQAPPQEQQPAPPPPNPSPAEARNPAAWQPVTPKPSVTSPE